MTDLKTRESLLAALRSASRREPTAEEIEKQRVSFILGSLKEKNTMSREKVVELLRKQEGHR
jgi:hypothetical protein